MFVHAPIIGTPTGKTQGIPTAKNARLAYMETLSDRIIQALKETQKNQSELARHVGVRSPSVNDWISGKTKTIKGQNLLRAAEFLGVTPLWLAEGKGPKSAKSLKIVTDASAEIAGRQESMERGDVSKAQQSNHIGASAHSVSHNNGLRRHEKINIERGAEIEALHDSINTLADNNRLDVEAIAALTALLQLIDSKKDQ